jgi:gluconolactonase
MPRKSPARGRAVALTRHLQEKDGFMMHVNPRCGLMIGLCVACAGTTSACSQTSQPAGPAIIQPAVGRTPGEPTLPELLKQPGLDVDRDLRNPLMEGVAPAALFARADDRKPVSYAPIVALGMETPTHGGWYAAGPRAGDLPADVAAAKHELWSYAYKQPEAERASGRFTPPPLKSGSTEFDPGNQAFGLWVSNENWDDGGVYTQPAMTARVNARLKAQPYKAMIYPNRDTRTGQLIAGSYLIGFEYSTNDDFQDVVARIDNVKLLRPDPPLKGILAPDARVRKLAGGFEFTEGPAWDFKHNALYFSDIPRHQIIRYADGKATVANAESGSSNGLMFDKQGMLIACEGAENNGGRRVSRAVPGRHGTDIVARYQGKRLNSPNDLWIDAGGGIYFTDPRYGQPETMELDKEAVYYVTPDGHITRLIDGLVRPNGIAISPDGRTLYVVDNGAGTLRRYPILAPGRIGRGERIAYCPGGDGMTVDVAGRLYVTVEGGVSVLDANGKWIGLIETPEKPANCTFGGRGYRTLFITAERSLYAVDTQTRGWHVHLDGVPR